MHLKNLIQPHASDGRRRNIPLINSVKKRGRAIAAPLADEGGKADNCAQRAVFE